MSDTKDDGGPFHPHQAMARGDVFMPTAPNIPAHVGATFRAVAAMHAMAQLAANGWAHDKAAIEAVEYADALIAELKK